MQRSDSITKLAPALVKAQGQLQVAIKDSTNPAFRSKYADLGAVWDACRNALQDNRLSVLQLPYRSEAGCAALETVLLHESGEYISSISETRLVKDDPQGYGSAITYLRRYALSAMLGIVADDDDGNAASGYTPGPQRQVMPSRPFGKARTAGIGNETASKLQSNMALWLRDTPHAAKPAQQYAGEVLGREVGDLADLSPEDAARVRDTAKAESKAS
ncbi:ERF family protein [Deinococcus peraridilitoris]|uniref:ERF superfamily protein n=1 Tax=Deinococcus peraridilitoris (strain DSM 19664 / LMG 22246 / CIP 109416 / KR-200) TaxID=937777 RepID=K9ZXD3_DEIPD|nr:ERF family protein [Deinococcus peraridilitoris]AFZ66231.1 ERF superfamily protein [Deinococcus peraridilitoris DSM 19664]